MEKSVYVIVAVLLGIGVLIFSFFVLSTGFGGVENIYNWIQSILGIYKRSEFEEAIMCSYYRCTEGCKSTKIVNLLNGKCLTDFCEEVPSELKVDDKICGINAAQYPVILEGFSSDKVFKRDDFDPKFTCAYTEESEEARLFYYSITLKTPESSSFLFPRESEVSSEFKNYLIFAPQLIGTSRIIIIYPSSFFELFNTFNHLLVKSSIIKTREPPNGICQVGLVWSPSSFSVSNAFDRFTIKREYSGKPMYIMSQSFQGRSFTLVDDVQPWIDLSLDKPSKEINFTNSLPTPAWRRVRINDINFIFKAEIKSDSDCRVNNITVYGKMAGTGDILDAESFRVRGETKNLILRGYVFQFNLKDYQDCEGKIVGIGTPILICDCKNSFASFDVTYRGQSTEVPETPELPREWGVIS
ncbi:MAG: hypothetical protein QW609_02200 [Candidatus Aenigmatarchaeota archaeon]